jgi:alpha-N-arabinofuranosidase
VEISCLAQLVNVIAPIRAEPIGRAWRQTIFHPFALTARHARGEVLLVERTSPPNTPATMDGVDLVDLAATHDPATGDICILAVNRSEAAEVQLDVDLRPFPTRLTADHEYLGGSGLDERNSYGRPELVSPLRCKETKVIDDHLVASLPPVSWSMIRLSPRPTQAD